jgi:uncharacterized Zn-binding protein involved in type VI secretion
MGRNFIVLGDPTSHGGIVISAWGQDGPVPMTINGIPVACVGDRVSCPKKGHTGSVILDGAEGPRVELAGRVIAYEGSYCSCGCVVLSGGQNIASHSSDSHVAYVSAAAASYAAQSAPAPQAAKGIQSASAEGGITAEEARLLKEQQDEEKKGFVAVFINNNGKWTGEHASVFIGDMNDKDRILYDPCGSYDKGKREGRLGTRGGDVLGAEQYDYKGYYDYHREDGEDIKVFPFRITKKEEKQIRNRILDPDLLGSCDMDCTVRTREVLRGIGPFKDLKSSGTFMRRTPKSLTEDMNTIKSREKK